MICRRVSKCEPLLRFNALNLAKIVCLAKWVKEAKCVSSDFLNEKLLMILTCIILKIKAHLNQLVSDKNSWDTLAKCCFFPSRAPLVPLKVVYRGLVTKSCTPTLRGQGDPKVSQPFWLRLCFRGILGMWLLVGSSGGKSLGRYMHVSEPFFREKH